MRLVRLLVTSYWLLACPLKVRSPRSSEGGLLVQDTGCMIQMQEDKNIILKEPRQDSSPGRFPFSSVLEGLFVFELLHYFLPKKKAVPGQGLPTIANLSNEVIDIAFLNCEC